MQAVLFNLLQRKMPGTKITCHALGMLERLLDEVRAFLMRFFQRSKGFQAGLTANLVQA